MSERKIGPREQQLRDMREARHKKAEDRAKTLDRLAAAVEGVKTKQPKARKAKRKAKR